MTKLRKYVCAVSMVISIVAVVSFFWIPSARLTSPLLNTLSPPHFAYYHPFVAMRIDPSLEGARYDMGFMNEYPGSYTMRLDVSDLGAVEWAKNSGLVLEVQVREGPTILMEQSFEGHLGEFFGHGQGYVLRFYDAPDDLPLRKRLDLSVTVAHADPTLLTKSGAFAEFVLSKSSDL